MFIRLGYRYDYIYDWTLIKYQDHLINRSIKEGNDPDTAAAAASKKISELADGRPVNAAGINNTNNKQENGQEGEEGRNISLQNQFDVVRASALRPSGQAVGVGHWKPTDNSFLRDS